MPLSMRPPGRRVADMEYEHVIERTREATGATTRRTATHAATDFDEMLQDLIDEDQANIGMYEEPWDDTNVDPRADTGEPPTVLQRGGDGEGADSTTHADTDTTGAEQDPNDSNDDNHDNDNTRDDNRDIQITYIAPGKRRRTTTLTRWDQHALRRMRQRLGGESEQCREDSRREHGSTSDSAAATASPQGNTRDRENDVTRVGVT